MANKNLNKAIISLFLSLISIMIIFLFTIHNVIPTYITIFILGFFGFAIVSPVQTQVMGVANKAVVLSSAANISAFNLGIALSTFIGGYLLKVGFNYISIIWLGLLFISVAFIFEIIIIKFKN